MKKKTPKKHVHHFLSQELLHYVLSCVSSIFFLCYYYIPLLWCQQLSILCFMLIPLIQCFKIGSTSGISLFWPLKTKISQEISNHLNNKLIKEGENNMLYLVNSFYKDPLNFLNFSPFFFLSRVVRLLSKKWLAYFFLSWISTDNP